ILFVVKYLQGAGPVSNQAALTPPTTNTNTVNINVAVAVPATDKISVELKATAEPVWISYSVDGVAKVQTLAPDESLKLDAKDAFTLSYSKAKLPNLQVSVNGKQIAMTPSLSKGNVEFEVTKANVGQVLQGEQTATPESSPTASTSPAATQTPKHTATPDATKTPRPSPVATTAPKPSSTVIIVGNKKPATPARPN
ncbi:MAG: hypothetical protein ABI878_11280, partial [Acidobacteriota bacterium]